MARLTIRERVPDDDARIVEIWNRINADFPGETVEEHRHEAESLPATARLARSVAEQDGMVVGSLLIFEMFWTKEPGRFLAYVGVEPERRHQGIGSALYTRLLEHARQFGAIRLYTHVREGMPEAERFAGKRGFSPSGHTARMSRLGVHAANLDGYGDIEDRVAREGIRLATLAELGADDEQLLHALHVLDQETHRDVPSSEEPADIPYENWYDRMIGMPGSSPHSFWVALDGTKPVGMAILRRQGRNAAWNSYTGVDRAYRGRGVARALKLRTIEWSRQNGVDYIYTGNDLDNRRMLSINIPLGYHPLPAFVELVKDLNSS